MTFKRIKNIVSNYLFKYSHNYIYKNLSQGSVIHQTAKLRGVKLIGHIKIAEEVKINGGVIISGNVEIGNYTAISGPNVDIFSSLNPVKIGKFCSIARNVSFQEYDHTSKTISTYLISKNLFKGSVEDNLVSKGPIIVGNDVWIGAHSIILSGVNIGNGAIISANSVVTKDVPPYAIVGGSPAKILKRRFSPEIITLLQNINWWDWDRDKLFRNKEIFYGNLSSEKLKQIRDN